MVALLHLVIFWKRQPAFRVECLIKFLEALRLQNFMRVNRVQNRRPLAFVKIYVARVALILLKPKAQQVCRGRRDFFQNRRVASVQARAIRRKARRQSSDKWKHHHGFFFPFAGFNCCNFFTAASKSFSTAFAFASSSARNFENYSCAFAAAAPCEIFAACVRISRSLKGRESSSLA